MLTRGAGKSGRQSLSLGVFSMLSVPSRTVTVQREKDGSANAEHDYPHLQSSGSHRRPRHRGIALPPSLRHRTGACRSGAWLHPRSAHHRTGPSPAAVSPVTAAHLLLGVAHLLARVSG